jgi:competence protein ComEA
MRHLKLTVSVLILLLNVMFFPTAKAVEVEETPPLDVVFFEVSVTGGVVFPGTYLFYGSVTVGEVIKMSGGPETNAVIEAIDQSRIIGSKTVIHVPIDETNTPVTVVVNINTASFNELLEIPYMTENRAVSLLIYRETHGPLMHVDELINVKNIGPVTLENLRPYVSVG